MTAPAGKVPPDRPAGAGVAFGGWLPVIGAAA